MASIHRSGRPFELFDDSMPAILRLGGVYTHLASDHAHYRKVAAAPAPTVTRAGRISAGRSGTAGRAASPRRRACRPRTGNAARWAGTTTSRVRSRPTTWTDPELVVENDAPPEQYGHLDLTAPD